MPSLARLFCYEGKQRPRLLALSMRGLVFHLAGETLSQSLKLRRNGLSVVFSEDGQAFSSFPTPSLDLGAPLLLPVFV